MTTTAQGRPRVGSRDEVEAARAALLVEEKALTRAQDTLAAKRRMLPAVVVGKDYRFQTERGEVGLVDLFESRRVEPAQRRKVDRTHQSRPSAPGPSLVSGRSRSSTHSSGGAPRSPSGPV